MVRPAADTGAAARRRRRGPSASATGPCSCSDQPVGGPRRVAVQLAAHVEQRNPAALQHLACGASTSHEAAQARMRLHVAQAAAALLEVGLEQEGELAEPLGPLAADLGQLRQPAAGVRRHG